MTKNEKVVNGVTYRIVEREWPTAAEYPLYWLGDDGSTAELTYDDKVKRDTAQ